MSVSSDENSTELVYAATPPPNGNSFAVVGGTPHTPHVAGRKRRASESESESGSESGSESESEATSGSGSEVDEPKVRDTMLHEEVVRVRSCVIKVDDGDFWAAMAALNTSVRKAVENWIGGSDAPESVPFLGVDLMWPFALSLAVAGASSQVLNGSRPRGETFFALFEEYSVYALQNSVEKYLNTTVRARCMNEWRLWLRVTLPRRSKELHAETDWGQVYDELAEQPLVGAKARKKKMSTAASAIGNSLTDMMKTTRSGLYSSLDMAHAGVVKVKNYMNTYKTALACNKS